jgi:hypothetical protein
MKYGYARVSTEDQNPALQVAALKKAGCRAVFEDEGISGATAQPQGGSPEEGPGSPRPKSRTRGRSSKAGSGRRTWQRCSAWDA